MFDYEIINEKLLKIVKIWTLEKEFLHLIFEIDLPKEVKTNCKTQSEIVSTVYYHILNKVLAFLVILIRLNVVRVLLYG